MKFKHFMEPKHLGAGIIFLTPDYKTLILKKKNKKWSFPGGHAETGETPFQTAKRECYEETGKLSKNKPIGKLKFTWPTKKTTYSFFVKIKKPYKPKLSSEHIGFAWKDIRKIPAKKMTCIFSKHWDTYQEYITTIL